MDTRTPHATFADLLQRYRRATGLTQEELAERAHLSVRGISNLERGVRRLPQRGTVALLIEALGLAGTARASFEAAARGLEDPSPKTPAKGTALTVPTNLPLALTSFVGRAREIATVRRLLGETRLLTLSGPGGCGKTRLALEVAHTLADHAQQGAAYADGIWLVELAALSDGERVVQAVATVLGVRERPDQSLLDSLTAFLCPKQVLLLLDNCEHLLGACAALADSLLRVCPRLTILATSREALGIAGEQPWLVPSLDLPDPRGRLTLEQAATSEAVQLFAQRAQVVRPDFAPTGRQVVLAAQICRRLDGIPLAIELAAARLAVLPLDQLATRLDDRFRLLTAGSRTALPRQQTLRATLDWSYDLLGQKERLLLQRLSVFAGGWTLDAAEAVCTGDGIAAEEVLDLLAGLVNKSLVLLEESGSNARYRMLETVRQYASELLLTTGEASRLHDRHLDWYQTLAGQAAQRIGGAERELWLERLETDLENFRTALHWSNVEEGRQVAGLRLAAALEDFWYIRGYASEGRRWLEVLLEHGGSAVPAALQARAVEVTALLTYYQAEHAQALALFEAAYALHSSEGNVVSATWALNYQSLMAMHLGDYQRATRLLEQVLPAHREQGDLHGVGWALCYLAGIQQLQGDYASAVALFKESLVIFEDLQDSYGIGYQLWHLANTACDQRNYVQARQLYRESLQVRHALMDKRGIAECLEGLAAVAVAEEQPVPAARLIGAAHWLRETIGTPLHAMERPVHDCALTAIRTTLGEAAFTAAWTEGQAMELEEAIALALEMEPAG
jgi:non-specific serine/threonine protein kinase